MNDNSKEFTSPSAMSLTVNDFLRSTSRQELCVTRCLKGTAHIFTKTKDGGIQRVTVNVPSDTEQVALVREHLRTIQRQFSQGDFSGPTHIHGPAMPGLSELKAAKPGQIEIEYKEVPAGAELTYRSEDKTLVAALHNWFDAQLSDHGADAMVGDQRHPNHGALMKQ